MWYNTLCNHPKCLIKKIIKKWDRYVWQNGMLRSVVTSGSAGKEKYSGNDDDDDDDDAEWNMRGKEKTTERQRRECS